MTASTVGVRAEPRSSLSRGPVLRLLGGFHLHDGERSLRLTLAEQRLLALLALRRRPVPRSTVAGLLWPDSGDARAAACLRSVLWRLRRLPRPIVGAVGAWLELDDAVAVDTRVMVEVARELVDPRSEGVPDRVLDLLGHDLLPDWYDEWVVVEREPLRQLRLHALEELSRRLAAADRHADAVDAALAVVVCEPLRDSGQRRLVEAFLGEGNRVEAVRQYRRYRDQLRGELGIEPSAAFAGLLAGLPIGASPAGRPTR